MEKLKLATRSRAAEPGAGAKTRLTKNDGIDAEARNRCIRTVYPHRVSAPCIRTVYPHRVSVPCIRTLGEVGRPSPSAAFSRFQPAACAEPADFHRGDLFSFTSPVGDGLNN